MVGRPPDPSDEGRLGDDGGQNARSKLPNKTMVGKADDQAVPSRLLGHIAHGADDGVDGMHALLTSRVK